ARGAGERLRDRRDPVEGPGVGGAAAGDVGEAVAAGPRELVADDDAGRRARQVVLLDERGDGLLETFAEVGNGRRGTRHHTPLRYATVSASPSSKRVHGFHASADDAIEMSSALLRNSPGGNGPCSGSPSNPMM